MMTKAKTNNRKKPSKPYPSFPLTAHNNGQWCKKVRGKVHFFGTWADPKSALQRYLQVAADLHAGRQPPTKSLYGSFPTVKQVCNHFLTHQHRRARAGEILYATFADYRRVAECFAEVVGSERSVSELSTTDFERFREQLSRRGTKGCGQGLGVPALKRDLVIARGLCKYAYETGLISTPMKYGRALDAPSMRATRRAQHQRQLRHGKRLLTSRQIRALLQEANTPSSAMILLGVNGGFGNSDCAQLPIQAIDFERRVIEFDRPKTGIQRVVPLWPETSEALKKVLAERPKPADENAADLVFLTTFGRPWVRQRVHRSQSNNIEKVVTIDAIGQEFDKLLRKLGLKRKGLGFYALRHTFRTWADEVNDQHAIHRIMGHVVPGMSGIYVQEIGLDRLRRVVNHVRAKLLGEVPDSQDDLELPV